MPKYRITVKVPVWVTKEVDAENEGEAFEKSEELDFSLSGFCGNGAKWGQTRLVGVYDGDIDFSEPSFDDDDIVKVE